MRETGTYNTTQAPEVPQEIVEKRRYPRTREYGAQQLEIAFLGEAGEETTAATLWDFGEGGLGMESRRPFAQGEELGITGELHGPDYSMRMNAKARVAYCRQIDAEFFRIGVAFVEVSYRRIAATSE